MFSIRCYEKKIFETSKLYTDFILYLIHHCIRDTRIYTDLGSIVPSARVSKQLESLRKCIGEGVVWAGWIWMHT